MATIRLVGNVAGPDVLNINANDATPQWTPGGIVVDYQGNRYCYVLAGFTTVAGGAVTVNWTDSANTGTNTSTGAVYKVIQPTTGTLDSFFGIMLSAVTSANYGWCQVSGYNQVSLVSTTLTSGKSAKVANASNALVDDTAQGTAPSFTYGANTVVSVTGAVPAIGSVFIRGMGSVLGI